MRVKIVLGILLIVISLLVLSTAVREPRNDRVWDQEVEYIATASLGTDGTVTIKNARDFTYGDGVVDTTRWETIIVKPDDIVKVWFVLEPFSGWKAIGHTFLSFELADGSAYSFSVEARREEGEKYSVFQGLRNEYELAYMWGTERDFITRRLLYLMHPVHMYPLTIDREQAKALFMGLIERTNDLAEKPRFYNTFTANCTNMLAKIANEIKPGMIPWDLSWYLPGYADRFLMRIGLIKTDQPAEEARATHDLTEKRSDILKIAHYAHAQFSKELREILLSE